MLTRDIIIETGRSHELALVEINEGRRYRSHCSAALFRDPTVKAYQFAHFAIACAREQRMQFGRDPEFREYTPAEILAAAIELCDYYEHHAREAGRT